MGFFGSSCEHVWSQHYKKNIFGGKSKTWHKCNKCGKEEGCSFETRDESYYGADNGGTFCKKCNQAKNCW